MKGKALGRGSQSPAWARSITRPPAHIARLPALIYFASTLAYLREQELGFLPAAK